MIKTLFFSADGRVYQDLPSADLTAALDDKEGLLWVDFEATVAEDDEKLLTDFFHFHPLAIDDALQEQHVPKVDDWGTYIYIVLHAIVIEDQDRRPFLRTQELDIFLGENYVVTHHDVSIPAVTHVWNAVLRDQRHLRYGSDHLVYRLADEIAASYMPVVARMDELIDQIEDVVFEAASPDLVEGIFALKRAVLTMRRILGPQREVLNKLARDDFQVIDEKAQVYFRDVYDHFVRMHDLSESIRDLVSGTMDTYLSVVNNRMNEIMKTLTVITTLFMPLSFVVGFFGMNFFVPDQPVAGWVSPAVFYGALVLMALMPAGMFLWIRRRGWM